jgi:hypothetical protein
MQEVVMGTDSFREYETNALAQEFAWVARRHG